MSNFIIILVFLLQVVSGIFLGIAIQSGEKRKKKRLEKALVYMLFAWVLNCAIAIIFGINLLQTYVGMLLAT